MGEDAKVLLRRYSAAVALKLAAEETSKNKSKLIEI
jgi:hypothetical protein